MTDLEITKLCAEAMGVGLWSGEPFELWAKHFYNPLINDAQAMELVRRFKIESKFYPDEYAWGTFIATERGEIACYHYNDLNRAICECVAKMQASKPSGREEAK